MNTTHVSLKTYYVQDRLGEIRPIKTKTYKLLQCYKTYS
jgi:hypothetical protein